MGVSSDPSVAIFLIHMFCIKPDITDGNLRKKKKKKKEEYKRRSYLTRRRITIQTTPAMKNSTERMKKSVGMGMSPADK